MRLWVMMLRALPLSESMTGSRWIFAVISTSIASYRLQERTTREEAR